MKKKRIRLSKVSVSVYETFWSALKVPSSGLTGASVLSHKLRSHKVHFLDGQLRIFSGYAEVPDRPHRISKMREHENLYPLPQLLLLPLANLSHASTELLRP